MTALNIGILLPTRALLLQSEPPRDLESILTLAESLEEAGYGSVWVGDSLLASPRPEIIVTLAALAARTGSIRIGSGILISSLRHPVHLAHQLATVDVISGGRLTVGIGYSSGTDIWKLEHEVVGVQAQTRHARAREGIEVMRALWAESKATHHGQFFHFEAIYLAPKPVQEGGPPIWVHGMRGEKTLRRVAEYGDGWINNLPTVDEFLRSWHKVRSYAAELGRDLSRFGACHYSTIRVGADGASAREQGRGFMKAYYGGMDPDEIERIECCRYGTPEACAEELSRFVDAGATTLILRLASENQREQIDLCTQYLLPVLKQTHESV
ncbi:MAG: LLM class flavin-dependent oxidoreductase [Acidiferrobacterales bacterium]